MHYTQDVRDFLEELRYRAIAEKAPEVLIEKLDEAAGLMPDVEAIEADRDEIQYEKDELERRLDSVRGFCERLLEVLPQEEEDFRKLEPHEITKIVTAAAVLQEELESN